MGEADPLRALHERFCFRKPGVSLTRRLRAVRETGFSAPWKREMAGPSNSSRAFVDSTARMIILAVAFLYLFLSAK
jgi:hypothetical protein